MLKYLEDYNGKTVSPGRTLTETDIVGFAAITGDWAEIHTNEEYCQKKSPFQKRIAHGALTFALSTGLIVRSGVLDQETFVAFYGIERLRFVNPVFIGDTLICEVEVVDKQEKGANGIVVLENRVKNQKEEDVLVYTMKVMVKKRPDDRRTRE